MNSQIDMTAVAPISTSVVAATACPCSKRPRAMPRAPIVWKRAITAVVPKTTSPRRREEDDQRNPAHHVPADGQQDTHHEDHDDEVPQAHREKILEPGPDRAIVLCRLFLASDAVSRFPGSSPAADFAATASWSGRPIPGHESQRAIEPPALPRLRVGKRSGTRLRGEPLTHDRAMREFDPP